jgi:hypothetical protein
MTLDASSREALAAAEAGDLDAVVRALDARGKAIEAGESPTARIVEDGVRTFVLLQDMRREIGGESARMRQIAAGFGAGSLPPHIDYRG